jgi:hypothetical protein
MTKARARLSIQEEQGQEEGEQHASEEDGPSRTAKSQGLRGAAATEKGREGEEEAQSRHTPAKVSPSRKTRPGVFFTILFVELIVRSSSIISFNDLQVLQ